MVLIFTISIKRTNSKWDDKTKINFIIFIVLLVILGRLLFTSFYAGDNPTISLHNAKLTGVIPISKSNWVGLYNPLNNHISVSIVNRDDVVRILYHEYGHYIMKKLNKTERSLWYDSLCNRSINLEDYYKFEVCNELFADNFEAYLNNKHINSNYGDYFREIVNKYLS